MTARSVSLVSCVSDFDYYNENVRTSVVDEAVERIPIDNAGNRFSAAEALNLGWERSQGDLVVFCHQDIIFPEDWFELLRQQVADIMTEQGARFGVAGTFGRLGREYRGHIEDRYGKRREGGTLPAPVETLDENCLVVCRDLPFRFDESLSGYHFYGVDLCLESLSRGFSNWALDCPLRHLGRGDKDASYYELKDQLEQKWRRRRLIPRTRWRIPVRTHGPSGSLRFGWRDRWRAKER